MPTERVVPAEERTRKNFGGVLAAIGLVPTLGLLASAWSAGRIDPAFVVKIAVPLALSALGLRLALKRKLWLEVDSQGRTYTVVRAGARQDPQPLDRLGPLRVSRRTRTTGSGNKKRTITEYAVHPAGEKRLDFAIEPTPWRARRHLERLARAWQLPAQSYEGDVRKAEALDQPLHRRLRDDPRARTSPGLEPAWRLSVEALSPGYAIVSRHRSWLPLGRGAILTLPIAYVFGSIASHGIFARVREDGLDWGDQVFLALLGMAILVLLVTLAKGALDTFYPGALRITPQGVSYRFHRIPLDEIEEVVEHQGIALVGDRRILRLPASFFPLAAGSALAQEIRCRIVEIGLYARMAGSA